jgi:hypothetical protein
MNHAEVFSAPGASDGAPGPVGFEGSLCGHNHTQHSNCHGASGGHVGPCTGTTRHTCTGGASNVSPLCATQNLCSPRSHHYTPGGCSPLSMVEEEPGA